MISVDSIVSKTDSKVKTSKKSLYDEVMAVDGKCLFGDLSDILMMAFAMGYRMNERCKDSGVAFVNVSSIDAVSREEYARLILARHPEVDSENAVWQIVQEYADAGISEIHKMMVIHKKKFNIDSYLSDE